MHSVSNRRLMALNSVAVTLALACGSAPAAERDVQFRSIDFTTSIIELHNFGGTDESLNRWQLCTHSDDDGEFRYTGTNGLRNVTIEAGTSLFLWVGNNAPVDSDNLNISSLSGQFASSLDQDAYSIGLYWPNGGSVGFGSASDLADHMQWNIGGADNPQADARSGLAQTAGLWTDQDTWISTTPTTTRIELTDLSGGLLHSPANYNVIEPFTPTGDFDGDNDIDGNDFLIWQRGSGSPGGLAQGDANNDGNVDSNDLAIWESQYGQPAPLAALTAVPEPQSVSLLLLGLWACLGKRRLAC